MLIGLIHNGNPTTSATNLNDTEVQTDGADITYYFCKIVATNKALMNKTSRLFEFYEGTKFEVDTITSTL